MSVHAAELPLTVGQLFERVEAQSRALSSARAAVDVARQGVEVARSAWLPDVGANLSISYLGNTLITSREFDEAQWAHTPHLGNSLSLEAQQVVYSGGAIPASIRLAELQQRQAEAGVDLTRQQQRFLALGQYLDLFRLNNRMRVYEQNIALTQTLIDNIREKHAQGMVLRNDITRYELQMEQLQLGLTALRNQHSIANHQLCNTLGLADGDVVVPDTTLVNQTLARDLEAQWQQQATASSPVLRQSALGIAMTEQQERLARSETRPKVALFAADNFNGPITFEIPPLNKNINVWYLGVGVKYNIGALYKSNRKVKQAQLARLKSIEDSEVAAQGVNNAIQAAHTAYEQSYVELATQQKSVELARQNYEVVNERYLNQLALITDMVDASNLLLNAQLQEVDARISIIMAYYKLHYLAGTL